MEKLLDDIKLFCADNPWADRAKIEEALCGTVAFDLALLGLDGEFSVYNDKLVDFLLNSKYETISVYAAHVLRKTGIRKVASIFYQPAQDYLAELRGKNSQKPIVVARKNELPRREYCETIIDALLAIDRHIAEGREMDLHTEVIYLHDEIFGLFMDRFDPKVLEAANEFFVVMDDRENFYVEDYDATKPNDKQSPAFYESAQYAMSYFYTEIDYIRETFLSEGWLQENSLSMFYLIAHAERCLTGEWYEE